MIRVVVSLHSLAKTIVLVVEMATSTPITTLIVVIADTSTIVTETQVAHALKMECVVSHKPMEKGVFIQGLL